MWRTKAWPSSCGVCAVSMILQATAMLALVSAALGFACHAHHIRQLERICDVLSPLVRTC